MAEFPALPLWTDAYIGDTAHLTNEEHGVYLRLLMFAWRSPECCLPDDDRRLAIMTGLTDKKWRALRPVIAAFWTIESGVWTQKRLTKERDFVRGKSEKNRDAAKARWNGNALENKDTGDAPAMPAHMPKPCQTDAPTPTPTPIKKETEAKASDASVDFAKQLWERGVAFLGKHGVAEKQARKLIGKWRKDYTDADIFDAFASCNKEGVIDPAPWITARLAGKGKINDKASRGEKFLRSFVAGASVAPRMDFGEDSDTSRPLLARR